MERLLVQVSWTRVQFPPPPHFLWSSRGDVRQEHPAESLRIGATAPPHFRGKPDDDYDVESYFYIDGELIRVKGPNDQMP